MSDRQVLAPSSGTAKTPMVSVVIPTYNEAEDIHRTLESLVRQTYPHREIIVVDDSTDATPAIVAGYVAQGVALIRPARNRGRCGARNLGIRTARGDVVVILNADVFPEPDFLQRIVEHYRAGADYVLVESRVANAGRLLPRFMQAMHEATYHKADWIEWTEGYSCRREAAIAVGLFPEEVPIPIPAGEDGYFGRRMAGKYRKVIDRSIVVPHVTPHTWRAFWAQHYGRGRGTPLCRVFLDGLPLWLVSIRAAGRMVAWLAALVLVVPGVLAAGRFAARSPRGWRDLAGFWLAWQVSHLALAAGQWAAIREIRSLRDSLGK